MYQQSLLSSWVIFVIHLLGFATTGSAANLGVGTTTLLTDLQNSGLGYNDLKFRHFCSKIPTVDTFGGHYSQMNMG